MFKKSIKTIIFSSLIILFLIIFQKCGDDSGVNATGTTISGTITYNDNLYYGSPYYFCVSFYSTDTSGWINKAPIRTDTLARITNGSLYYKDANLSTGNYYVASTIMKITTNEIWVLGVYGCDTVLGTPTVVQLPNYAGTGQLNFRSKTNLYNKLGYYHP